MFSGGGILIDCSSSKNIHDADRAHEFGNSPFQAYLKIRHGSGYELSWYGLVMASLAAFDPYYDLPHLIFPHPK